MDKLSVLLASLDRSYNPDFWSEVELSWAARQLEALDDLGWDGVMQAWSGFTQQGQINLVEACGASQHPRGMRLLEAMVTSTDAQVGAAIANQMITNDYDWNPEISIRSAFERHKQNLEEGYQRNLVERMLLRLPR
jgi:hypothetical protein